MKFGIVQVVIVYDVHIDISLPDISTLYIRTPSWYYEVSTNSVWYLCRHKSIRYLNFAYKTPLIYSMMKLGMIQLLIVYSVCKLGLVSLYSWLGSESPCTPSWVWRVLALLAGIGESLHFWL